MSLRRRPTIWLGVVPTYRFAHTSDGVPQFKQINGLLAQADVQTLGSVQNVERHA